MKITNLRLLNLIKTGSRLLLATLLLTAPLQAATILVDFKDTSGNPVYASGVNNYNNTYAAVGVGLSNMKDTGGTNTGFSLATTAAFTGQSNTGSATTISGAAATAGFTNAEMLSFFFNNSGVSSQLTFSGLTVGTNYTFTLLGSRAAAGPRIATYAFAGAPGAAGSVILDASAATGSAGNSSNVAVFSLAPNASGVITLNISNASSFSYINALKIDYTAVPEPSTWALLAGGLVLLFVFRRRLSKREA